MSHILKLSNIE